MCLPPKCCQRLVFGVDEGCLGCRGRFTDPSTINTPPREAAHDNLGRQRRGGNGLPISGAFLGVPQVLPWNPWSREIFFMISAANTVCQNGFDNNHCLCPQQPPPPPPEQWSPRSIVSSPLDELSALQNGLKMHLWRKWKCLVAVV